MIIDDELRYYAEQDRLCEIKQELCNTLLQDIKAIYDKRLASQRPLIRLMMSFAYWGVDYEKTPYVNDNYKKLNWPSGYYDVINSFWITFSLLISKSNNTKIYKKTYPKMLCEYLFNNANKYVYTFNYLQNAYNSCNTINELAYLCHCVANFMPCPDDKFNSVKGSCIAHDYLPVMIDLIQDCINKQEQLTYDDKSVNIKTLCSWHKWFVDNLEKYYLQDYYKVTTDDKGRTFIKGNKLFKIHN